jgi:hypothetical protein
VILQSIAMVARRLAETWLAAEKWLWKWLTLG